MLFLHFIKHFGSWILFVEKTENADFTDFQTRILSYNQRYQSIRLISVPQNCSKNLKN